jgi:hypothetical protein
MASNKRAIRLLLDPWVEAAIVDIAKKEGRSLASAAMRMIEDGLAQRRSASHQVARVVKLASILRGDMGATS